MYQNHNIKHFIRFRRWSRKAYAVLVSLKSNVTIGFLSKNIADKSLCKQKKDLLQNEINEYTLSNFDIEDKEKSFFIEWLECIWVQPCLILRNQEPQDKNIFLICKNRMCIVYIHTRFFNFNTHNEYRTT